MCIMHACYVCIYNVSVMCDACMYNANVWYVSVNLICDMCVAHIFCVRIHIGTLAEHTQSQRGHPDISPHFTPHLRQTLCYCILLLGLRVLLIFLSLPFISCWRPLCSQMLLCRLWRSKLRHPGLHGKWFVLTEPSSHLALMFWPGSCWLG